MSDRGWGLNTLDMIPDDIVYLKGASKGSIVHPFKMKYSLYVKKYNVTINYSCDKQAIWKPFNRTEGQYFMGNQTYTFNISNERAGDWVDLCSKAEMKLENNAPSFISLNGTEQKLSFFAGNDFIPQ